MESSAPAAQKHGSSMGRDKDSWLRNCLDRTMYVLSIVAAIFLPLGFLTGLLGINVGGMPGMDDPDAFWAVVALCLFVFVALIVIFRRLRWL